MPLNNVVAPFSQVTAMSGLGSSAAKSAGACHNFTLHWISLMLAANGNSSDSMATGRMATLGRGKGEANPVLQKIFGNCWTQESIATADRMMFGLRGLKNEGDAIAYNWFDKTLLVNKVTAAAAPGFVYSFWFPGGTVGAPEGAHTIGFFRRMQSRRGQSTPADNIVSAFDPNFGECRMVDGDFAAWVDSLKTVYGGTINTHWLKMASAA